MAATRIGLSGIALPRLAEEEAISMVSRCLDLGINFIDTASSYGTSEEWIGKAISGRRQGLVLATKSLARQADELRGHLERSLSRLAVDTIDLYQFHLVDVFTEYEQVIGGLLDVIDDARREGRVRYIGLTSHDMDVAKEAVKSGRFEAITFPFNPIAYEAGEQLLPLCRGHDVSLIAMKATAGGLVGNATLALKYLWQFPNVVTMLDIEKHGEIDEIVPMIDGSWELTEAEKDEIQQLRERFGTRFYYRGSCC